jgi:hypothetical protein
MKTRMMLCAAIAGVVLLLCGCDPVLEELAKKNCKTNPPSPAGPAKRVALFVKHHIFVVGQGSPYDPNLMATHPYAPVKWKNADIVAARVKRIGELMPKVNQLFANNGDYIFLYDNGYDVRPIAQDQMQADMDWGGDRGKTSVISAAVTAADPTYIHVLWFWTSTTQALAVGVFDSVDGEHHIVIGDDPIAGSELNNERTLAHEFVHALGYATHVFNDPGNLMNDGPLGDTINPQQYGVIWASLNAPSDKLLKFSCDK